jgi:LacI family transcriptional regulator
MNSLKPLAKTGRVTIRSVAADAGVSVAAVSKVLRNAYGVSDGLREKVTHSIERLGYRPNVAARGMRGQTFTIGVLLVELRNPFLPQIIDGVNEVLGPSNYKAMIGVGEGNAPIETSLIESMIDYRMDGLILVAPRISGDLAAHYGRQIPCVVIGHHEPTAEAFDTVSGDDRAGAMLAVQSFLERGYRDIGMMSQDIDGDKEAGVVRQREIGFLAAMAAAGLDGEARLFRLPRANAHRHREMLALLKAPNRPRALFCWSDLDAVDLLSLASDHGIRVPQDLAIIAYDNSSVAALSVVNLASIDQSGHGQGQQAAKAILSRIEGRTTPHHILLEPKLVMRRSLE